MRRDSPALDLIWIALAVLVIVGAGFGLRDPWPADEPRFASLARDMVASGDWLFPRVGGDLYQDKPPLFFWLLAGAYALVGSVRWSFLLPSLLAAFGTLALVYDLVRRLHGRIAGLSAALVLLCTLQFLLAARAAQIDATLCLLTTLSLYGLLRHLLLGPAWGWYFVAGLAAGLGVITKGVGFLPLLVLLPYALLRMRGFEPLPRFAGGARWALAPLGFVLGIALWAVPMLVAVARSGSAELAAYRDEILFQQTVDRYAGAWHHVEPWYYFFVRVIPVLWLPLSLLLIWLVPRWRDAWRARDARVWLPLGWVALVLLFFSASAGKRGIYILPALPALAMAAAPYLPGLAERRGVRRASLALGGVLLPLAAALVIGHAAGLPAIENALASIALPSVAPFVVFAAAGALIWIAAWRWRPVLAWPAVLAVLAIVWGLCIAPSINGERSARTFMQRVAGRVAEGETLGLIAYKEQFLLYLDRPAVNFGHRRWLEGPQEAFDAARWLDAAAGRVLLVAESNMAPCFEGSQRESVGRSSRSEWFLVRGAPAAACIAQGSDARAIEYPSQNAQN
ncbi:MAG TPA: glycosyltransferase family 39 protein [Steroidobacteraceae bacterium]|nr:glycosyltransferase family 39 protein [Steroidobacteraceae bacterium]